MPSQLVEEMSKAVPEETANAPTETAPAKLSATQQKSLKKQQKKVEGMLKTYYAQNRRRGNSLKAELKAVKNALGKDSYKALKDIATVRTPEVKNEAGEVTQAASERVNYRALLIEGRNLISVLRAERTKLGKRSAQSGRSSDRSRHNSLVRYLLKRNEEAKAEEVKKAVEIKADKQDSK